MAEVLSYLLCAFFFFFKAALPKVTLQSALYHLTFMNSVIEAFRLFLCFGILKVAVSLKSDTKA